jgi:hypothetical protein
MTAAPECFCDEIQAFTRKLKRFNMRWHLSVYPKDIIRFWWDVEGDLPSLTSRHAFDEYKAGAAPRRKLYEGPLYFPRPSSRQLSVVGGGHA